MLTAPPPGKALLAALERRLIVFPALRARLEPITAWPPRQPAEAQSLVTEVVSYVQLYAGASALEVLTAVDDETRGMFGLAPRRLSVPIEGDDPATVTAARGRALEVCGRVGFGLIERTKVATAVSELARNIALYAGRGSVEFHLLTVPRRGLRVVAIDAGPGIAHLDAIFAGDYRSKQGMGAGLRGVKRIAETFHIDTGPGGTRVTAAFYV